MLSKELYAQLREKARVNPTNEIVLNARGEAVGFRPTTEAERIAAFEARHGPPPR